MNPLFIDPVNFLIAQDDEAQVVGIGQVRPLGEKKSEYVPSGAPICGGLIS